MKYMVRAGWEDVEFESDNPDVQFAVVVWVEGRKEVKGYEEEESAVRAMNRVLKKYDSLAVGARAQYYPAFYAKEGQ